MPITFSITCDSDAELAHFLENFRYSGALPAITKTRRGKAKAVVRTPKSTRKTTPVKKMTTKKTVKKVGRPTTAKSTTKAKMTIKAKAKPKKVVKAKTKTKPMAKKPVGVKKMTGSATKLTPMIQEGIQALVRKGDPFRAKDVTDWVVKKYPALNASSVTTGVSKLLSQAKLNWKQIKDVVGRPYKLYQPK